MRERDIEAYFRTEVRRRGGMAPKLAPTEKGLPDRLVLLPGGIVRLVELKAADGVVSPAQSLWHDRAAALGTPVTVLSSKGEVDNWLARECSSE